MQLESLSWFPGHMTKTRRMVASEIGSMDAVCEIIDARIPRASRNPDLDDLTAGKPRIVVLNRVDQADPKATKQWAAWFRAQGYAVLEVDAKSGAGVKQFAPAVRALLADKLRAYEEKGQVGRVLRVMVLGIPNVGKSTFINKVSGRKTAKAEDRPGVTRGKQWVQEYTIPARPSDTVLDCLLTIKRTVDPTLAFRYSCGHGMCGSDAVAINGTPTLLCTATIRDWAKQPGAMPEVDDEGFRHTGTEAEESDDSAENVANAAAAQNSAANGSLGVIELASLPGFPPQRDLIADIDPMLNQIRKLTPYLQADGVLATTAEGKVDVFEYLQNPEQLAKYELLSNCIACGVCEGACPVYAGGDAFIGPAALIWASRFVNDSRDTKAMERMDAIDTADGVAACQSVRACSRHCPRGIDVGEEMWQIVAKVRER